MIGKIAQFLGLDTLIVYAIIALLAGGGLWAYSAYRYHEGYNAGSAQERILWEEQRKRDLAKRDADKAATQAIIDRLTAELELDAHKQKDDRTTADLKKEQTASKTKGAICAPRKIARILNRAGR